MTVRGGPSSHFPRWLPGYGIALLLVLLALGLGLLLGPDAEVKIAPLHLIVSVALTAWLAGRGPALAAVLFSSLLVDYFWVAPRFSLALAPAEIPWFLTFILVAFAGMGLGLQRRRYEAKLAESRNQLEQRVLERTAQLQVSEERWRRLFETSSVGIAVTLPNGRFLEVNRALQAMLGYSEQALQQLNLHELIDGNGEPGPLTSVLATAETRRELPLRHHNGQIVWVDLSLSFIPATDHTPILASAVINDVTERRRAVEDGHRARAELSRASRLTTMGVLAASIAHEVNQPLSAVVTNGEAAQRWLTSLRPNLPEAIAACQRLIKDGNRAASIVRSIRQALAPAGGSPSCLSMNEVIRQLLPLIYPELASQEVDLRLELTDERARIIGDPVQLQQLMLNLVMNSLDSLRGLSLGKREIIIRTSSDPWELSVSVEDNGKGFTEDYDRLFEAFYTTKANGMGVGLAICHWVVESHGGQISAEPCMPCGARVFFSLPLAESPGFNCSNTSLPGDNE